MKKMVYVVTSTEWDFDGTYGTSVDGVFRKEKDAHEFINSHYHCAYPTGDYTYEADTTYGNFLDIAICSLYLN